MGANRGGAQTLTPPTLQGPEPSPLLREVSCPHGCFASHAQLRSGPRLQTETWPTATALAVARTFLPFLSWTTGKGEAEGKGCVGGLLHFFLPLFSKCFLALQFFCFLFPFSLDSPLPPPSFLCPCRILPFLSLLLFLPSLLPLPLLFLIPALLISLPQHPVLSLWCVLVLATARPARTDGYLLRQRSPWAPTLFPPPGAAQVSR